MCVKLELIEAQLGQEVINSSYPIRLHYFLTPVFVELCTIPLLSQSYISEAFMDVQQVCVYTKLKKKNRQIENNGRDILLY